MDYLMSVFLYFMSFISCFVRSVVRYDFLALVLYVVISFFRK